jgi:hypothetical protein
MENKIGKEDYPGHVPEKTMMVGPVRNIFCSWYPSCLSIHVRHNKRRFNCSRCVRYRPIHLTPEEVVEEGIKCGEFLNALFFGVDPYAEKEEMKKQFSDDEMVLVPARFLRGLMFSFTQGMSYFAGTSNLIQKLDGILKQGKLHGQQFSDVSGNTSEREPGTEGL